MTRTTSRVRQLERQARRDSSLEVWHEMHDQPGVFERIGPWSPGNPDTITRDLLDATDPPDGVRRIVVCYVDGEPSVQD